MSNSLSICKILLLFSFLVLLILFTAGLGFIDISPVQIFSIIGSYFYDSMPADIDPSYPFVIMEVRLPRILVATLVGGGLAVAGCVFQSLLQNPLADPYTLGISSGAAFGASIALLFGMLGTALPFNSMVPVFAFAGAVLTLYGVFALSSGSDRLSSTSLILSGIIISAILSAGISFIKFLADEQVNTIIFWIMGSFIGKSWTDVFLLFFTVIPCLFFVLAHARELDVMTFGDKTSESLGVESKIIRRRLLIASSLATAVCVSVSGIIGFVGLIVPHLVRLLTGPSNQLLIPASFFTGCMLLLGADTITRVYLPSELPIGILTALIGGPVFCYIFRRSHLGRWKQ